MSAQANHAALQLGPELTIYSAAATRDALLGALIAMGAGGTLTLDLGQVCEVDSAGVQVLLAARRHPGCTLELHNHSGAVNDALALLGLDAQLAPLEAA
jgi:anti-anti-sigma factor